MENQFQIQFLHVASRMNGDHIVHESLSHLGKEGYEVSKASIIKTSANLFEKEGKLFLKFIFNYNPLIINSEIECELYEFIGGDAVYFCDGLFEVNAYSFFIFKNDFIIQGSIKRDFYEGGKRLDLFDFVFYGKIDDELKSKLPGRPFIYEFK